MMGRRKKRIFAAAFALVLVLSFATPAFAANRVTEIDLDVTLRPDGSAAVVQTWNGNFDEGTECYFPVANLGDMTMQDLQVSGEDGPYTKTEPWDTGASFEEKARRFGQNPIDGGYEVCWGISKYGESRYTVEYTLNGLIGDYDDADGFLFQFVPSGMNTGPTDVTVRITAQDGTPLTDETADIWAFGFEGQITFEDGGVLAYTEEPITGENSIILMLQLKEGVFTPARTVSGLFEDVKTRAFEDSDYGGGDVIDGEDAESLGFYTILGVLCIAGAVVIFRQKSSKRRWNKLYKDADYWREAPVGGNLEASFVLADSCGQTDEDGNLIAAVLTRLLTEGCLVPETEPDAGWMGREKECLSLRLVQAPDHGITALMLYDLLVQAAGNDGVLQERELERYCKNNYAAFSRIVQEARRDGGETLESIGCLKPQTRGRDLSNLTGRGRTLLFQLMGYKKYLLDFSLIAGRGVNEALIWQDCLTYAALFGIGEQVIKELRKFYPDGNAGIRMAENTYVMTCRYSRITYQAAKNAEAAARRGSGGFSSLGGGGGFSGGGSGGGTR